MLSRDSRHLGRLYYEQALDATVSAGYQIRISYECDAPDWDSFLVETPGGHHVQTSLWGQVKALLGWHVARVVVTCGERIVAGAQLLIRLLPFAGAIGYVIKGPLIAVDDPLVAQLVVDAVHQVARVYRIQYLVVQPPDNGEALAEQLLGWGFRPSSMARVQTATILLDLTRDLDEILAQMRAKTRYNIRHGQRKGIVVREGTERDLHTFYRLLVATSRRQKFSLGPEEYFSEMWRVLAPLGYARLFLAEYEGEAVSALLAIPFADTVIYKKGAWSGRHGSLHPNEVMHWTAIMWAKAQGYRYYDFEGINPGVARALVGDKHLSGPVRHAFTSFKLGFGGQVALVPGAYDHVYNPVLRWGYRTVFPKIASSSTVKNARRRLDTHLRTR